MHLLVLPPGDATIGFGTSGCQRMLSVFEPTPRSEDLEVSCGHELGMLLRSLGGPVVKRCYKGIRRLLSSEAGVATDQPSWGQAGNPAGYPNGYPHSESIVWSGWLILVSALHQSAAREPEGNPCITPTRRSSCVTRPRHRSTPTKGRRRPCRKERTSEPSRTCSPGRTDSRRDCPRAHPLGYIPKDESEGAKPDYQLVDGRPNRSAFEPEAAAVSPRRPRCSDASNRGVNRVEPRRTHTDFAPHFRTRPSIGLVTGTGSARDPYRYPHR